MSKVNEFLLQHRNTDEHFWYAPRIVCADGFSMSVQVHKAAYCRPRDGIGPIWTEAEIGFPSEQPNDDIMGYVEDALNPTDTVYGYVPMALIDALVEEHGGISGAALSAVKGESE